MENKRLLALDIMRGLAVGFMILGGNPGSWSYLYAPLAHSKWHGLTPIDTVFPLFIFIMGISTYISLKKFDFKLTKESGLKIFKRAVILFLLGLLLGWISRAIGSYYALAAVGGDFFTNIFAVITNLENFRIMGVLQRLSLAYLITAVTACYVDYKKIPYIIFGILSGYFLILILGNGFEMSEKNIIGVADRAILGVKHMYRGGAAYLDPEGLLSTVPAAAQCLLGFMFGKTIFSNAKIQDKMLILFIWGTIFLFGGFLLSYGGAINKTIWSPSYVLVTSGIGALLLGVLIWTIDVKGYKKWSRLFEYLGSNALFIFVAAGLATNLLTTVKLPLGSANNVRDFMFEIVLKPYLGPYPASLMYAVLFMIPLYLIAKLLYKKKIFIKL